MLVWWGPRKWRLHGRLPALSTTLAFARSSVTAPALAHTQATITNFGQPAVTALALGLAALGPATFATTMVTALATTSTFAFPTVGVAPSASASEILQPFTVSGTLSVTLPLLRRPVEDEVDDNFARFAVWGRLLPRLIFILIIVMPAPLIPGHIPGLIPGRIPRIGHGLLRCHVSCVCLKHRNSIRRFRLEQPGSII